MQVTSQLLVRRLMALVLVGLAGGIGVKAAPPPVFQPQPITWGACSSDPRLQARGAQCGFLVVPLDYAQPNGEKISLAVSRMRHTTSDAQNQGVMIVNPGGPGASGLIYAVFRDFIPPAAGDSIGAGQTYDWIGFDPRGVGASQPALSCDASINAPPKPAYRPTTLAMQKVWVDRSKAYADDCADTPEKLALLRHLSTVDSAADLESLRLALGTPQLNFYGFNYGTYLGQIYATQYPDRVRRMVLDSTVNPLQGGYLASLEQDVTYQTTIDTFFDYVAAHDSVFSLGATRAAVRQLYLSTIAALDAQPANGVIGGSELTDIVRNQAGSNAFGWVDVATAFSAYVNHADPLALIDLYGLPPFADNNYAIGLGTLCTDSPWPLDQRVLDAVNLGLDQGLHYDYVTWANAWRNGPCAYWKVPAQQPVRVDGRRVLSKILMVGETFDALTPFSGSLIARGLFPTASLIEGKNGTSDSVSISGVACVDNAIAAYLRDGTTPPRRTGTRSDLVCSPVPPAEP